MEQFKSFRELPDLYITVVIKLFIRYLYLWLNASKSMLDMSQGAEQPDQVALEALGLGSHASRRSKVSEDHTVFNKERLLKSGWDLILKFKRKCLPDILQFRMDTESTQYFGRTSSNVP